MTCASGLSISAVADPVTLHIVQGLDFGPIEVVISNPDNTPMNLTGATAEAQIRRRASDTEVVVAFSTSIVALAGKVILSLSPAASTLVPAVEDPSAPGSRSVWDLVVRDTLGRLVQIVRGDVRGYLVVTR